MSGPSCEQCEKLRAELALAQELLRTREGEIAELRNQLHETMKLVELQRADLDRYREANEKAQPNRPERVAEDQLQLAFERVLASLGDTPAAKALEAAGLADQEKNTSEEPPKKRKKRDPHGRRRLDLTNLPVERIEIDPDDVIAAQGAGFVRIGEEISERVALKPAAYIRLRIIRGKWVRVVELVDPKPIIDGQTGEICDPSDESSRIITAPLPESVWPNVMADPSAIAHVILSKYDDSLPLHRQERISTRQGFTVPRSTQCGWLGAAYNFCYRIVDAMFAESCARAFCIATDATGVRVRAAGACDSWTVFVFIADKDHVVFRYAAENTSAVMEQLLRDFRGRLLSDAATTYDALHRLGVIELACWFHARRYFWRALESDPDRATEALSLISLLFKIDRDCHELSLPERTSVRAEKSRPVLDLFDAWVQKNRNVVDPRGPLDKAIVYYDNQRTALHRFLEDGRIRLDNNLCEQQLRNTILGENNWMFFENETGLRWYTAFRSLIASCRLHDVNSQQYVEEVLRLAPNWPVSRILELAPKYWRDTRAKLDDRQRAMIIPPWELSRSARAGPDRRVA